MSNWTKSSIQTNGILLTYHRTGRGENPPLVLAHGITDSGLCWTRVAKALEKEYDIIMVDARGHGESDRPEDGYSPDDHADDLAGLIEGLGLEKPRVMGHSMGASTVSNLASHYPHLVGKVVLEDPPPQKANATPEDVAAGKERMTTWRARLAESQKGDASAIIAQGKIDNPKWHESEFDLWSKAKMGVSLNVFNFGMKPRTPWPESVANIQSPTLLVTGDPELGAIVSSEHSSMAEASNPQIQVAHIPEVGHNIRRDNFERFVEVVREFLA